MQSVVRRIRAIGNFENAGGLVAFNAGPGSAGPVSLDGNVATGQASATDTVTTSTSLTTTKTNDVIIVIVIAENQHNVESLANVTATGLLFQKYASVAPLIQTQVGSVLCEVWWAPAVSTFSGTISASINNNGFTTDDSAILAFAVNGANLSAPFDANTSLMVAASGPNHPTTSAPTVTGVSTNSINPFVVGVAFSGAFQATADTAMTAGSGYSVVGFRQNVGGGWCAVIDAEAKAFSGAQSNITVTWASTFWVDWSMVVFALTS